MTDQLMDDLTNEEHEALLLMSEHGIAPPLSAAADAVLDAYSTEADRLDREVSDNEMLAAALRAAALYCKRDAVTLLAIADELEGL